MLSPESSEIDAKCSGLTESSVQKRIPNLRCSFLIGTDFNIFIAVSRTSSQQILISNAYPLLICFPDLYCVGEGMWKRDENDYRLL
jgi:hypothetical protein